MNLVFDTNVLLSATLWDGSVAQKLLFKLIRMNASLFTSPEILAEYRRVLGRDFDYADEEIALIVEKLSSFVILVTPREKINIIKEDPTDNKILECASAAGAAYVVTYDRHLLKLKAYRNITIIKPEDALKLL